MQQFAYIDPHNLYSHPYYLYSALLLFDKLYTEVIPRSLTDVPETLRLDLEYLQEKGALEIVNPFSNITGIEALGLTLQSLPGISTTQTEHGNYIKRNPPRGEWARAVSAFLSKKRQENILPFLLGEFDDETTDDVVAEKGDVYRIAIGNIPTLTNIPLEEILRLKEDQSMLRDIMALRNWVNEVTNGKLTMVELQQKLEYLLLEYEAFMRLQKIKYTYSSLETIIVSSAEILENVIKLNLATAAKAVFKIKRDRVALLESEFHAPGREIAFIQSAATYFKEMKYD